MPDKKNKVCPSCKSGHLVKVSREDKKIEPIQNARGNLTTITTTYSCDKCGHNESYVGQ